MIFYTISLLFLSLLLFSTFAIFYRPKRYRHLKKIPFYGYLKYAASSKSIVERFEELYRPNLNKEGYTLLWQPRAWNLIVTDYKIIKEVVMNTNVFHKNPVNQIDYGQLNYKLFGKSNIVLSDKTEWRHHRKSVNPAFKKSWDTKIFAESGYELIDKIESRNRIPTDMNDMFQQLTLDVLGRGLFSYDFFALKNGDKDKNLLYYKQAMSGIFNLIYITFPFLDIFAPKLIDSRRYVHQQGQCFRVFLEGIIDSKRKEIESGVVKDDIVSLMIRDSMENEVDGLTNEEILNNLTVFFLAGHDTTANTLTSTLYFLAKNQDIQDKARQEVLNVVGDSDEVKAPTNDQEKKLPYIDCIIKESMRISPTVNQLRRHASKDITLSDGTQVKKGDMVMLLVYLHHRNPEYFPEPEKFDPDRFKDPHGIESSVWMPFGMGTRTCVGLHFSLIEQRVILSMLLQKYTIRLGPNCKQWETPKFNSSGFLHIAGADIAFEPRLK
ncbi:cytochrome P450 [Neoconidiobolus thromboides FSU 785]|nr:cytochrome P450 [Neoconidiobolus thromboides FSU 785]